MKDPTQPSKQTGVVYLNGKSLDRGTFTVGKEFLTFDGWQGHVSIPLRSLQGIEVGTSNLPARAGIPILSSILPGPLQQGDTLLLTVQENERAVQRLAVIANVKNGEELLFEILMLQDALSELEPPTLSGSSSSGGMKL